MTQLYGATRAEGGTADRRTQIEALLVRYPRLDDWELAEMKAWFRYEATPLEVGMLTSEPQLARPYRQFAADHLEPLTLLDYLRLSGFFALVAGSMVAIAHFVY